MLIVEVGLLLSRDLTSEASKEVVHFLLENCAASESSVPSLCFACLPSCFAFCSFRCPCWTSKPASKSYEGKEEEKSEERCCDSPQYYDMRVIERRGVYVATGTWRPWIATPVGSLAIFTGETVVLIMMWRRVLTFRRVHIRTTAFRL